MYGCYNSVRYSVLVRTFLHPIPFHSSQIRNSVVNGNVRSRYHSEPSSNSENLASSSNTSATVTLHALFRQGCTPYSKSWAYQQVLLSYRLDQRRRKQAGSIIHSNDKDCIMMLESSPVYTLGRGADENHLTFSKKTFDSSVTSRSSDYFKSIISERLSKKVRGSGTARLSLDQGMEEGIRNAMSRIKNENIESEDDVKQLMMTIIEGLARAICPVIAPNGVPIYRVDRGGEVTYHGPSQLVVYPLFDLKNGSRFQSDLHWYLRMIEEVIIQSLSHYDIKGSRDDINTGVWVGTHKIAAVGVSSSRWITTHGFALNVDPDLTFFDTSMILPCGIEGRGVTSIGKILRERGDTQIPSLNEVADVVMKAIEKVFGVQIV